MRTVLNINVEHALWPEGGNLRYWLASSPATPVVAFSHGTLHSVFGVLSRHCCPARLCT